MSLLSVDPCLIHTGSFEKVIYIQLCDYMGNYLNQLLYFFCKAHSIEHALFKLIQSSQKELNQLEFVGTIIMNPSKAYDCLSHDLIVAKLEASSLAKESRGRKVILRIVIESNVIRRIPQSSILGPLLFNIFINNIFRVVEKSDICNFADDNSSFSQDKNLP